MNPLAILSLAKACHLLAITPRTMGLSYMLGWASMSCSARRTHQLPDLPAVRHFPVNSHFSSHMEHSWGRHPPASATGSSLADATTGSSVGSVRIRRPLLVLCRSWASDTGSVFRFSHVDWLSLVSDHLQRRQQQIVSGGIQHAAPNITNIQHTAAYSTASTQRHAAASVHSSPVRCPLVHFILVHQNTRRIHQLHLRKQLKEQQLLASGALLLQPFQSRHEVVQHRLPIKGATQQRCRHCLGAVFVAVALGGLAGKLDQVVLAALNSR
jgi:hypothetical protein